MFYLLLGKTANIIKVEEKNAMLANLASIIPCYFKNNAHYDHQKSDFMFHIKNNLGFPGY